MGAMVPHTHFVLRSPTLSSFTNQSNPKLGKPIFSLRDVPLPFTRKDLLFTISCIGPDGNRRGRPPQRNSISGRETSEEENTKSTVSEKPSSSSQEEIIALFRRIKSSISKEGSENKITSNASEDNSSSAESILRILSGKKPGKTTNEESNRVLTRRRGVPKKEPGIQGSPPVTDLKLTRLPSKFVKRSPIPYPTTPRGKLLELNNGIEPSSNGDGREEFGMPRVEEMKLPELKQLAKSRGIKGYSRMKKRELVSLLKS